MFLVEELLKKDSCFQDMAHELQSNPVEDRDEIMTQIYEYHSVRSQIDMDTFLFDPSFLGIKEGQIYPKVRELLWVIDDPAVREIFISAGKGSGKSTIVGIAQVKALYNLLSYINPAEYYGLLEGTFIGLINMSISAPQALNVIFKRFVSYVNRINRFQKVSRKQYVKYKEINEGDEGETLKNYKGGDIDTEYFSESVGTLEFTDKSVLCLSGHSKFSSFFPL